MDNEEGIDKLKAFFKNEWFTLSKQGSNCNKNVGIATANMPITVRWMGING